MHYTRGIQGTVDPSPAFNCVHSYVVYFSTASGLTQSFNDLYCQVMLEAMRIFTLQSQRLKHAEQTPYTQQLFDFPLI